jgi:hypothetical protein
MRRGGGVASNGGNGVALAAAHVAIIIKHASLAITGSCLAKCGEENETDAQ